MSFGFSVDDFITVGRLIQHVVSSLRASSISEYRELILELHGLQRALHEIEHLKCNPCQEPAVSGIKVAALMCQYPLDELAGKLKKFNGLINGNAECISRTDKAKMWGRKLRWGFCVEEEVTKLRAYLVAHVGSLNMRLITQGLRVATLGSKPPIMVNIIGNRRHLRQSRTRKPVKIWKRGSKSLIRKWSACDMTFKQMGRWFGATPPL